MKEERLLLDSIAERVGHITELWQADEMLKRKTRLIRMLNNCNQVLLKPQDEDGILREVCRICVEDGKYHRAWVGYIKDGTEKDVRPVAKFGFEDGLLESLKITRDETQDGQGPAGTAIRTQKPCIVNDLQNDPQFAGLDFDDAALIALPLRIGGKVSGVFMLFSTIPGSFEPEEVGVLKEMVNDLSLGIETLRVRTEQLRLEEKLIQSDHKYRLIADNLTDVIWVMDVETLTFTFISPSIEKFRGFTLKRGCARP